MAEKFVDVMNRAKQVPDGTTEDKYLPPRDTQVEAADMMDSIRKKREDEQIGVMHDTFNQVLGGIEKGTMESSNLINQIGNYLIDDNLAKIPAAYAALMHGDDYEEGVKKRQHPVYPITEPSGLFPETARTGAGGAALGFVRGISQFVAPYSVFAKGVQAAKATGKAAPYIAGAMTDLFAFSENNLANVVQDFPALQNPVTEFLKAEDDDSEAVKRMKGAVMGVLGAGAIEGAVKGAV